MLYSEFLNGTEAPDNRWTYKEYERINNIYNNNNDMDKSDAYKLYREPDQLTLELMSDLEDARQQSRDIATEVVKLRKQLEALQEESATDKATIKRLKDKIQKARIEAYNIRCILGA